jgi:hypothetical protein
MKKRLAWHLYNIQKSTYKEISAIEIPSLDSPSSNCTSLNSMFCYRTALPRVQFKGTQFSLLYKSK